MEVIIYLGYVYPEWGTRAGANFIPTTLDIIENETFDKDT